MRTAAATGAPITSTSSLGSADLRRVHHRPGAEQPEGDAVAARGEQDVVGAGECGLDAISRQHPERARGDDEDDGRNRPEALLDRHAEDRDPHRGDEEIADVGIDEGGGEVSPPLPADRTDDGAQVVGVERRARHAHEHQHGGDQDRRDHGVGALGEHLGPAGARQAAPDATRLPRELVASELERRKPGGGSRSGHSVT